MTVFSEWGRGVPECFYSHYNYLQLAVIGYRGENYEIMLKTTQDIISTMFILQKMSSRNDDMQLLLRNYTIIFVMIMDNTVSISL